MLRRALIRLETTFRELVDSTLTGDPLADKTLIALRHIPDLSRDELGYLLHAQRTAIDGALETLRRRRLATCREVWRLTK